MYLYYGMETPVLKGNKQVLTLKILWEATMWTINCRFTSFCSDWQSLLSLKAGQLKCDRIKRGGIGDCKSLSKIYLNAKCRMSET